MIARCIALIIASASLPAMAQDCRPVDASHGNVSFEVDQAGSPFRGAFRRFGGAICLAGDRVTRIDVWLDPSSVDAGLPEIDAALKGAEFFGVDRYPRAEYASGSIEAAGNDQIARGTLQMKGVVRELDVPFRVQRQDGDFVVSGALTLNRLDYNIGTGEWSDTKWLGGGVKVSFTAMVGKK